MVVLATIEAMKLSGEQKSEEPDAPYPYPTDTEESNFKLPSGIDETLCILQHQDEYYRRQNFCNRVG
jgi:hypothetical protein